MKNKIYRIIAIIMICVLALSGCSKKNNSADTADRTEKSAGTSDTKPSFFGGAGKTSSGESGAGKTDSGESGAGKTEPTADFETVENAGSETESLSEPYLPEPSVDFYKPDTSLAPAAVAGDRDYSLYDFGGGFYGGAADDGYSGEAEWYGTGADDGYFGEAEWYGTGADSIEGWCDDPIEMPYLGEDPIIFEPYEYIAPSAGLLTAAEWNDNRNYDFVKNLITNGQQDNYGTYFREWGLMPFSRIAVRVTNISDEAEAFTDSVLNASGSAITAEPKRIAGTPVSNAKVTVTDMSGNRLFSAFTGSDGRAYLYYALTGDAIPAGITVEYRDVVKNYEVQSGWLLDGSVAELTIETPQYAEKSLDLMFVIDTTGSMWDEMAYLQVELEDIIKRVETLNGNLPIRLSVNFYRDHGDAYVIKSNEFSNNAEEQLMYLRAECAEGGGDYEEAVEEALADAVDNHSWNKDSIKLMFMVLDAPPHSSGEINASLANSVRTAGEKGIHIIPVASSGVDKPTEFLLRALAMATGGTYTFLTDDSGIGESHLEPTVGDYTVEQLNNMLVRIITEYLQ